MGHSRHTFLLLDKAFVAIEWFAHVTSVLEVVVYVTCSKRKQTLSALVANTYSPCHRIIKNDAHLNGSCDYTTLTYLRKRSRSTT